MDWRLEGGGMTNAKAQPKPKTRMTKAGAGDRRSTLTLVLSHQGRGDCRAREMGFARCCGYPGGLMSRQYAVSLDDLRELVVLEQHQFRLPSQQAAMDQRSSMVPTTPARPPMIFRARWSLSFRMATASNTVRSVCVAPMGPICNAFLPTS